jgi:hypothetical protein
VSNFLFYYLKKAIIIIIKQNQPFHDCRSKLDVHRRPAVHHRSATLCCLLIHHTHLPQRHFEPTTAAGKTKAGCKWKWISGCEDGSCASLFSVFLRNKTSNTWQYLTHEIDQMVQIY